MDTHGGNHIYFINSMVMYLCISNQRDEFCVVESNFWLACNEIPSKDRILKITMVLYFMSRKLIRTHAGSKPDSPNVLSLSHVAENIKEIK